MVLMGGVVARGSWNGTTTSILPKAVDERLRERFVRTPALVQGIVLAAAAVGVHLAAGAKAQPFIYGQF